MKKKYFKVIFVSILSLCSLVGCSSKGDSRITAYATFYLEGGTCQTNNEKVSYRYYLDDENQSTYIADPNTLKKDNVSRVGYTLVGWSKSKDSSGTIDFKNTWDFSSDKMSADGVTLYACWEKDIQYTFDMYYKDENNEDKFIYSYKVNEGEAFEDFLKMGKRSGYTILNYTDISGNVIDETNKLVHPGGDESNGIKVYVNYIKGEYELVSTKEQLRASTSKGIYLMNDIDLEGENLSFNNYTKVFEGNNHTISNFNIYYDPSELASDYKDENSSTNNTLYISLFKRVNGGTIRNVNFVNGTIDVNTSYSRTKSIVVTGLATRIEQNAIIDNVNVSLEVRKTKVPTGCSFNLIKDASYVCSETATVSNTSITVNEVND